MQNITHFGYNRTDAGSHLKPLGWSPVIKSDSGPLVVRRDAFGMLETSVPLLDHLNHLIDHQKRLCRIWVRLSSGTERCVYWYEEGKAIDSLPILEDQVGAA